MILLFLDLGAFHSPVRNFREGDPLASVFVIFASFVSSASLGPAPKVAATNPKTIPTVRANIHVLFIVNFERFNTEVFKNKIRNDAAHSAVFVQKRPYPSTSQRGPARRKRQQIVLGRPWRLSVLAAAVSAAVRSPILANHQTASDIISFCFPKKRAA